MNKKTEIHKHVDKVYAQSDQSSTTYGVECKDRKAKVCLQYIVASNRHILTDSFMNSAVMAIDITNNCIGIALAYHRQHDVSNREASPQ